MVSDEDLKEASIYLNSLLVSIRKNVSCLLLPLFLLHPFKIKLEAAGESIKPLPNFHSSSGHVRVRASGSAAWE